LTVRQRIQLMEVRGLRVAYATMGDGPLLLFPPPSFGHLAMELESREMRSFFEALASRYTLVRYDRVGTGLSDRERGPETLTLEFEVDVLEALVGNLGSARVSLFGSSYGGVVAAAFSARRPELIKRLLLFGAYADGAAKTSSALLRSITGVVRADWELGSRLLIETFLPHADREMASFYAGMRRESCCGEMAASLIELWARTDLRDVAPQIMAPTLALHRREDPVVPVALGRALAALVPDARFELLDGCWHHPWLGDMCAVLRLAGAFFGFRPPPPVAEAHLEAPGPALTTRELEVLRLVAEGLSDDTIAERLVLSAHTVHRHMANIRTRLRQRSRAAAVAQAARTGLI